VSKQQILKTYGNLPLRFESNHGQTDRQVNFLARSHGYTLFLAPTEAVLVLGKPDSPKSQQRKRETPRSAEVEANRARKTAVLRMQLLGANPHPRMVSLDELPGKSNYFIGNNSKAWHTNVPNYARVRYEAVYPGVDLVYYGNQRQLEYDFVVAPGSDPKAIRLGFEGAEKLSVDADGDLILRTRDGAIRLHKPIIYQKINEIKQTILGHYALKGKHQVGFHVANYDSSKPLVIDPVLSYSTYLGGTNNDQGLGIAVDSCGNAYVTGFTNSSLDFPTTTGALQTAFGGSRDAFVTKLNATGSALVYSTYLGGTDNDEGHGIAVDAPGNAYVTGFTESANFPVTPLTAFQPAKGAGVDAFVTKLNPTGSGLVYSTFLGSNNTDQGSSIAVDALGNAYITGFTASATFPTTTGASQTTFGGVEDAFVTKLNAAGSGLSYSTFLGGTPEDRGLGIAVDIGGSAYVTGFTVSSNFPTTGGAFQTTFGGSRDAFVTKLNAAGSARVYSTYLGGTGIDEGLGIAVDIGGSAYVTGFTVSSNFPTTGGAFQTTFGGVEDAFVTKLDAAGSGLSYSTFLGGTPEDRGFGISVDIAGSAYIAGVTASANFPTTAGAPQTSFGGGEDAFVTKLDAAGSALTYSTYLGGGLDDRGLGIIVDGAGNAYVTGVTDSANFPTSGGAFQTALGSIPDAFIAKIAETTTGATDLCIVKTDSPDPVLVTRDLTYTLTVTNIGPDPATAVVVTDTLPPGVIFLSSSPSQGTCSGTSPVTCNLGNLATNASATVTILINPTVVGTLSNSATVTSGTADPNPSNDSATASTTVSATPPPGSGVDGCFIATASFGSPLAAEVETLRAFRDQYLLPHAAGRWAVAAYYRASPPLAALIRQHEAARAAARGILWPIVWWARMALISPALALIVAGGICLGGVALPVYFTRLRRRRTSPRPSALLS
jgi:uncharacterized repeat protein (TIGR01451 family)